MSIPFRSITALGATAILASPVAVALADAPTALEPSPSATLQTSPSPTVAADEAMQNYAKKQMARKGGR